MKKMLILILSMMVASSAFAVIDADPDMLGIYFDTAADVNCTTATPYQILNTYVIMTNPTNAAIGGFEFGYDLDGLAQVLSTTFPPNALDVGSAANHIVGLGSPLETTEATVLATLSVMNMDGALGPIFFSLHGSNPSSIDPLLPTILFGAGELMTLGTSTIPGTFSAVINGVCEDVVATEETSFDALKSLYR